MRLVYRCLRSAFDHTGAFKYTTPPNPTWKPGDGLSPKGCATVDDELYEQFDRSRTAQGQRELFRQIRPGDLPSSDIYKLMIGGIVPRPIGFVSSLTETGITNLAPFSYFQAAGHQPPMLFLFFSQGSSPKDTCANIKATKEFSVNIISEPFVEAANFSAVNAPPSVSEWSMSGLTQAPSTLIKPPRVAESAFSMECVLEHTYDVREDDKPDKITGTAILGRIKIFHVRTDLLNERGSIRIERLLPVSRLAGVTYGRTTSAYDIVRPRWDKVADSDDVKAALSEQPRTTDSALPSKEPIGKL